MLSETSRYAGSETRERIGRDGRREVYVLPRVAPQPESYLIGARHRVSDSDRLDMIAYRAQGRATAFHGIADANRAMHPSQLTAEPGEALAIPALGAPRGSG